MLSIVKNFKILVDETRYEEAVTAYENLCMLGERVCYELERVAGGALALAYIKIEEPEMGRRLAFSRFLDVKSPANSYTPVAITHYSPYVAVRVGAKYCTSYSRCFGYVVALCVDGDSSCVEYAERLAPRLQPPISTKLTAIASAFRGMAKISGDLPEETQAAVYAALCAKGMREYCTEAMRYIPTGDVFIDDFVLFATEGKTPVANLSPTLVKIMREMRRDKRAALRALPLLVF